MHFKSGSREPKATLEIGENTYKIMPPTVGQSDKFAKVYAENKGNAGVVTDMMQDYICELGSIPKTEIVKIENDMFLELFTYVISGKKN
jgi:hypothetical protein